MDVKSSSYFSSDNCYRVACLQIPKACTNHFLTCYTGTQPDSVSFQLKTRSFGEC